MRKPPWILMVFLFTLIAYNGLKFKPEWAEQIYALKIFSGFRVLWDGTIAHLPFSLVYLWLCVVLICIVVHLQNLRQKAWSWILLIKRIGQLLLLHACLFYWMWGFHYSRVMPWKPQPISDQKFYEEYYTQKDMLVTLKKNHTGKSTSLDLAELEETIKVGVAAFLHKNSLPANGSPRCKFLYPKGSLLVWSTAGVYVPFAGESIIDPGLPVLSIPFTMAHEIAHAYGITDEGICNFIAYFACYQHKDASIRYAGTFNYFKYLLREIRLRDASFYRCELEELPEEIKQDMAEVHEALNRFPEFLPELRNWLYDFYLKRHGVMAGHQSYHEVVALVIQYKMSQQSDSM